MNDRSLRRLEHETDPAAKERLLATMLRGGTLPLSRLRLLAYLGLDSARNVLASEAPKARLPRGGSEFQTVRQWIIGLGDVCEPDEREVIARECLQCLVGCGFPAPTAAQLARLKSSKPWAVIVLAADICFAQVARTGDLTEGSETLLSSLSEHFMDWALAIDPEDA